MAWPLVRTVLWRPLTKRVIGHLYAGNSVQESVFICIHVEVIRQPPDTVIQHFDQRVKGWPIMVKERPQLCSKTNTSTPKAEKGDPIMREVTPNWAPILCICPQSKHSPSSPIIAMFTMISIGDTHYETGPHKLFRFTQSCVLVNSFITVFPPSSLHLEGILWRIAPIEKCRLLRYSDQQCCPQQGRVDGRVIQSCP